MRLIESNQQQGALQQENTNSNSEVNKCEDSQMRVWKNLEKILDQFEQDLLKGKEELNAANEYFQQSKNYFNWDIQNG